MPDPIGWIWYVLVAAILPVLLRWELRQVDVLRPGISANKAVFPSPYLMRMLASGSCVGARSFYGVLSWWQFLLRRLAQGLFNKLEVGAMSRRDPCCSPISACHGDGGEGVEHAGDLPGADAQWKGRARGPQRALDAASTSCGAPQWWQFHATAIFGQRGHSALGFVSELLLPP